MRSSDDLTTSARIRDAAIAQFGAHGFNTGVRAIATAAGVSPGLVIHHFGSKDGLRKACDEYESMEWHASATALRHDRMKVARLQECGWTSMPLVVDDVRRYPAQLVARIFSHLERPRRTG